MAQSMIGSFMTNLRSWSTSFALYIVINDVLADGMMIIGVLETRLGGPLDGRGWAKGSAGAVDDVAVAFRG